MIRRIWQRYLDMPLWLKIVWLFCVGGMLLDSLAIYRDLQGPGVLLRLHVGFWVLYTGQVIFILWGERMVCLLALLQAALAVISNLDFTFVPLVRAIGGLVYRVHGTFSIEEMEVYKYVFVSVCFTLELLKAALLFLYLSPASKEE